MIPGPGADPDDELLPFTPGFALVLTVGAAFVQVFALLLLQTGTGGASPARFGIATIVGYGLVFALGTRRLDAPPAEALGFLQPHSRAWLAALLLLPSLLLISEVDNLVRALYPPPEALSEALDAERSALQTTELFLVSALVLPFVDELFFRGLLQPRMVSSWGRARGVGATSLLAGLAAFALAGVWGAATRVVEALVLGLLRESARSIWPSLALNVAFGLVSALATLRLFGIPGFDDLEAAHTPLVWLVPAALATGVGLRLCRALLPVREGPGETGGPTGGGSG